MAVATTIFQPLLGATYHGEKLVEMLKAGAPDSVTISTAFLHSNGVRIIEDALKPHAAKSRCYVGVRNGVSSIQGIKRLLGLGVAVFVVDTGSQRRLFHPKFYAVRSAKTAELILGSANLTYGGLGYNLEASVHLKLDLDDAADAAVIDDLDKALQELEVGHPQNCYAIADEAAVDELFERGLLEDETVKRFDAPVGIATEATKAGTSTPSIKIPSMEMPKGATAKRKKAAAAAPVQPPATVPAAAVPIAYPALFGSIVWIKKDLPKSDLQFADGNPTGALRLAKAGYKIDDVVIDNTTYFRNVVFGDLSWAPEEDDKEVTAAPFLLSIGGIIRGEFQLAISHKPSREAKQGNVATNIHWGEAKLFIQDENLIGRDLVLREPSAPGAPYAIEID